MSTRGFEFAYCLDGSGATPVIRDFILGEKEDRKIGDLMVIQSDGAIDKAATGVQEVTCIMQEKFASADVTADSTTGKAAIVTRGQVWRCSTDAATATGAFVGIKQWDLIDENTIDAGDTTTGSLIVVEGEPTPADIPDHFDEEGNVIGYVVFADTTFGNT